MRIGIIIGAKADLEHSTLLPPGLGDANGPVLSRPPP
jgi:hypothetical protein